MAISGAGSPIAAIFRNARILAALPGKGATRAYLGLPLTLSDVSLFRNFPRAEF